MGSSAEDNWKDDTLSALEQAARGKPEEPPATLYHYTSGAGLAGMVRRGPKESRMRAYNIRQMSDYSELDYGLRLIIGTMMTGAHGGSDELRRFVRDIDAMLGMASAELNILVACFSAASNDLSQWRAYKGRSSGFAIGCRTKRIAGPGLEFRRVIYKRDEQLLRVNALIAAAVRALETAPTKEARTWLHHRTANLILDLACVLKDPAYEVEKEWRLVVWQRAKEPSVKVDANGQSLRTFIELEVFTSPDSIEDVWIGPGGQGQFDAVTRLLQDYKGCQIKTSEIPER